MKLWWHKHPEHTKSHAEAQQALEREKQAQAEIRAKAAETSAKAVELDAKRPVVEALGQSLARHYQANHFSELIIESMRRKHA